jgi:uncharacterized protein
MTAFRLASIPAELSWRGVPNDWTAAGNESLSILAAGKTDLFVDPGTEARTDSAPAALFAPPDARCRVSARVRVAFGSTYDAGALHVWVNDDLWAKLCYEFSPQGEPTVVSVVNRGVSDDCNSVVVPGGTVHLRVTLLDRAVAFHYSLDGGRWSLVRYFSLGTVERPRVGFSSQSPTGPGCRAEFTEIRYREGVPRDLRSGE